MSFTQYADTSQPRVSLARRPFVTYSPTLHIQLVTDPAALGLDHLQRASVQCQREWFHPRRCSRRRLVRSPRLLSALSGPVRDGLGRRLGPGRHRGDETRGQHGGTAAAAAVKSHLRESEWLQVAATGIASPSLPKPVHAIGGLSVEQRQVQPGPLQHGEKPTDSLERLGAPVQSDPR